VLLLFVLLIGLGVLAYLQTPLGSMVKDILGISGTTTGNTTDTTKPVISSIVQPASPDTLGPTSASIGWKTDELASTQVEYGTTATYGKLEPAQPANDPTGGASLGVIDHSVVLTGLQPNTTYTYRVKSKDAAGNEAVSEDNTFTTTSAE
jgi:phosphodiesterase/alkaline phosphatase D-like protein